jgi:hypothetical protein
MRKSTAFLMVIHFGLVVLYLYLYMKPDGDWIDLLCAWIWSAVVFADYVTYRLQKRTRW